MNKKIIILIVLLLLLIFLFINSDTVDDNILYIPNFLDEKDYQEILKLRSDKNDFIFEKFRYAKPLSNKVVHDIFYNDKYFLRFSKDILN